MSISDKKLKRQVLTRDGHKCRNCRKEGEEVSLHIHHIVPSHLGGGDHIQNLVSLCQVCHKKAHQNSISDRIQEGVSHAQREGKWTGRPPVGFETNDDGYLVVDVEEYEAACDALGRIGAGESYRSVAKETRFTRPTLSKIDQDEDRRRWYLDGAAEDERISEALSPI